MTEHVLSVLVHVPKTAGTALNSSLVSLKLLGRSHCEAFIDNPDTLRSALSNIVWISGHVTHDKMRDALTAATDRPLALYSAMRDPHKQVMSHYNWLIEIYHRDAAFYNGHPEAIRTISKKIRNTDHTDPRAIISILESHPLLFLNVQSRYILSGAEETGANAIPASLKKYRRIGYEDTMETLLSEICGTDARLVYDNISPYHFDKSVFQTDEMVAFLKSHNAIDQILYDAVRERWTS